MAIPKYALLIPAQLRVSFLCKTHCRVQRYGRRDPVAGSVTCGKCGGIQYDESNWKQRKR